MKNIGSKGFTLYILILVILLALIVIKPTFGAIEITVDDNENVNFTTVENSSEEDIDMLLYLFPLCELDKDYYEFGREVIDWGNLTYKSNLTVGQLEMMLPDNLKQYAINFKQAEDNYDVNALFLIALARLESGNGTYKLMEYNNIFSYGAFDDDIYKAIKFDSIEECITVVSGYLKDEYLTENGKWFNGLSIEAVNIMYASDQDWASKLRDFY